MLLISKGRVLTAFSGVQPEADVIKLIEKVQACSVSREYSRYSILYFTVFNRFDRLPVPRTDQSTLWTVTWPKWRIQRLC